MKDEFQSFLHKYLEITIRITRQAYSSEPPQS